MTEAAKLRRKLKQAHKHVSSLLSCVNDELLACSPAEIKEHPVLLKHSRAAASAQRFLKTLETN